MTSNAKDMTLRLFAMKLKVELSGRWLVESKYRGHLKWTRTAQTQAEFPITFFFAERDTSSKKYVARCHPQILSFHCRRHEMVICQRLSPISLSYTNTVIISQQELNPIDTQHIRCTFSLLGCGSFPSLLWHNDRSHVVQICHLHVSLTVHLIMYPVWLLQSLRWLRILGTPLDLFSPLQFGWSTSIIQNMLY